MKIPFLASALALACFVSAQGGNVIQPFKTEIAPKPSIINTNSFNPRIKPVTGQGRKDVRNEFDLPKPANVGTNTLPVGGLLDLLTPVSQQKHFPGIDATGWVPPDPDIAVGPTHIVNVVNVAVAFFKKDGTKVFEQDLGRTGFFQGVATNDFVFDPKCFFDPVSQRFFIVGLELGQSTTESFIDIAVSDDSNPEGNWFRYHIDVKQTVGSESFWLDYPGFGFCKDAIMLTGNMFGFTSGFNGIQFIVMQKAPMLTGGQPVISKFSQGGGSVQIARTNNDPTANVLYGVNHASTSALNIFAIKDVATTPVLVSTTVAIPTFTSVQRDAISVGGNELSVLDGRMMNVYYRGGNLLCAHSAARSGSDDTPVSRWYDMKLNGWPLSSSSPSLTQSGQVGTGTADHWMPAICSNNQGEIAVVMSRCSPSIVADFVIAARRPTDPLGTMRAPVKLTGSVGTSYGGASNRWGDYFGIQPDPTDDRTFWGVGMVANASAGWVTVIEQFRLSTPFEVGPGTVSMFEGLSSSGTVTNIKTSDNKTFNVTSKFVQRTGQVASAQTEFTLPGSTFELAATFEAKAVANVTGSLFLWNNATSKWVYFGSTPLGIADTVKTINIGSTFSQYVSSTRKVKALIRAILPERIGSSTPTFILKIDQVKLTGSN
ncbi:MAG: hypothetical protein ABL949_01125 [Fimbriimonadaceae bacterium]